MESIAKSKPDVVLIDANLPDSCGVNIVQKLIQFQSKVKIILFTGPGNGQFLTVSLDKQTKDFEVRDSSGNNITQAALRAVYLVNSCLAQLSDSLHSAQCLSMPPTGPEELRVVNTVPFPEKLTPREIIIMKLMAKGLQNKEIAYELGIKTRTVEFHVTNILSKLGVDCRVEAVLAWVNSTHHTGEAQG